MFSKVDLEKPWMNVELDILKLWDEKKIFNQSLEITKALPTFVFFEGPPTANGKPGIHHILARAYKDLVCRYKTMDGFHVARKAGWDTHGLPVELEVEKRLQIEGKKQIEEYGLAKFIEKCKESIFTYKGLWEEYATKRIGYWVDMDHPYVTCSNDYIESVWWGLKEIFSKGMIYKGYKSVPHCPRCQTTLSSHEVAQGYKEVQDPSIHIQFPLQSDPSVHLLVWTTTPWTLTANVAAAVKPDAQYAKVKAETGIFIVAKDRIPATFEEDTFELLEEFPGSTLVGMRYHAPFHFFDDVMEGKGHIIIAADYVSMDEGTGIVHIAPAFGVEDMEAGKENNLPLVMSIEIDGTMKKEVTPWKGMWIKDADKEIIADLKKRNLLFKSAWIQHTYPFCWRCKSPLIYMAKTSWFIQVSSVRNELQNNNEMIQWYPDHIKKGRFGEWLQEAKDWAISRERYWGTPLNIWECENCGHTISIGSIQELKDLAKEMPEGPIDLHRPYVDSIQIKCPHCCANMKRVPGVLDCWLDSGSMPFAQHHYPFEHKEDFSTLFPADFITEGIDQTRGWFYTMLTLSTLLFQTTPYKNVLTFELILDQKGEKMSKSRGNVVDVQEIINTYGADAIRWSMYTSSTPYVPRRFMEDQIKDALKNFIIPMLNVLSFFVTYANIDQYEPVKEDILLEDITSDIDRWILSKCASLAKNVKDKLDVYDITESGRLISIFVDELTNWYIRRSRRRFWKSDSSTDKQSAYQTLFFVLLQFAKIISPFTPFLSDYMYQVLKSGSSVLSEDSVHLHRFPTHYKKFINSTLEKQMDVTRAIVTAGLRARKSSKVKVRTPFSTCYIYIPEGIMLDEDAKSLIQEELNVKNVIQLESFEEYAEYSVKPNLPILGKKYGSKIPLIRKCLDQMSTNDLRSIVTDGKAYALELSDQTSIPLSSEDLLLKVIGKPPYIAEETFHGGVVVLDPTLQDELRKEGYARELVHHIQIQRKQLDLNVEERIRLVLYIHHLEMIPWIQKYQEYICTETLSESLETIQESPSNAPYAFELTKELGEIGIRIQSRTIES
jgi:isoleucyl-tRNA synthetase